jgi:hypothetical protein
VYGNSFSNSIEQPVIIKPPVGVLQRSVGSGIVMSFPPDR